MSLSERLEDDQCDIKNTYLSIDGIPSTITINERSHESTVVQFTTGHRYNDKTMLGEKNFAWNRQEKTYVRVCAQHTSLSALLQTYAIQPDYIMPDNDTDFNGHCLLTPRCFLVSGVFAHFNAALSRAGFKWTKEKRTWIKKMKLMDYRNDIMTLFKKAPLRVSHHGTEQVLDAKQDLKKLRQEEINYDLRCKHQDTVFEQKRHDLMYRLHKADSDPDYQRASYIYGQQIKRLAEQGIYDYPEPPKLPRYR
eukprot:7391573-Prymnesium_polylepis.1